MSNKKPSFVKASSKKIGTFFKAIAVYTIAALFLASVIMGLEVGGYIDKTTPIGGALHWIAGVIMMVSIESASLGSFGLASEFKKDGQSKRAGFMSTAGVVLTLITIVTAIFPVIPFQNHDQADKILTCVRIAAAVIYAVIAHNHGDDEDEEKQIEVNDQRILDIDKRVSELATSIDTLTSDQRIHELSKTVQELAGSVHTLSTQYTNLYTQVSDMCIQLSEVVDKVHKPVDMSVYTQRLDALESMVKVSVTEVKQNILQITQNNMYTQIPGRVHNVVDESTVDADDTIPRLSERTPTTDKHPVVPALVVPGVSENKVREVLTAFLTGTGWREMPGNYSRTIKPIREAYEAYMEAQVHSDVYTYTNA
jgi:hypothetical protein